MDALTGRVDTPAKPSAAAYRNLITATVGFTLTFWAWNLVSPLGGTYKERLT